MTFRQRWDLFWTRFAQAWDVLCGGLPEMPLSRHTQEAIQTLLASEAADYVQRAVDKVERDPSFRAGKDHTIKLKEAQEWSGTYAREAGTTLKTWERDFLIQWLVGQKRGFL